MEEPIVLPEDLIMYRIILKCALKNYKSGETLEAIILPIRGKTIDDRNTWTPYWFVYDGEKLIAKLTMTEKCFDVYSSKRKNKNKDMKEKK